MTMEDKNKEWFEAVLMGNLDTLHDLLQHGVSTEVKNEMNRTALMVASQQGLGEVVQFLVEHGAKVVLSDKDGWTALTYACFNGHLEIAETLIKYGAGINDIDTYGSTVFQKVIAVYNQSNVIEIIEFLLKHGAIIKRFPPIVWAAWNGKMDIVKYFISKKVNIDEEDAEGKTALMRAATEGYDKMVEFLLLCGADFNKKSNKGETVLDIARGEKTIGILKSWVESEGDI